MSIVLTRSLSETAAPAAEPAAATEAAPAEATTPAVETPKEEKVRFDFPSARYHDN